MTPKLKKIIFDKLYQDLKHVEIIPYNGSIWFIDRKEKYWYLIYHKNGILNWRYQFFPIFFNLFCLEYNKFEPIISEWVEEVLNCKVVTPGNKFCRQLPEVEEVLNFKVVTPRIGTIPSNHRVEEVLNCKVVTPEKSGMQRIHKVEEVLNCKVVTPKTWVLRHKDRVEEVLNCKVVTTSVYIELFPIEVEEVLNSK